MTCEIGNEVFDEEALYADSDFFSVFTFPFIGGGPKLRLTTRIQLCCRKI